MFLEKAQAWRDLEVMDELDFLGVCLSKACKERKQESHEAKMNLKDAKANRINASADLKRGKATERELNAQANLNASNAPAAAPQESSSNNTTLIIAGIGLVVLVVGIMFYLKMKK